MPLAPSPAVLRAADLLHHLAANPSHPRTVSQLARELDLPRATCDTLLLALAERGFVRRDGALRYELGPSCMVVGDAARDANAALRAAAQQAEALARSLSAFVAVSIRDGHATRVASVFDFAPPLGLRARVGEAIQLVPPFGASFVAWDDPSAVDAWLARAEPPLDDDELQHYHDALAAVRRRGYSVTLMTARQPTLIDALERSDPDARRAREEAAHQLAHSEYLTADLDPRATLRVAQVSAPVFDADGRVAASLMLLGPNHELSGAEVAAMGAEVVAAAERAS